MNLVTPDKILATPVSELADQSSVSLFRLKTDAADFLAAAKAIVEHIDRALDLKYVDRAHQLRLAASKDIWSRKRKPTSAPKPAPPTRYASTTRTTGYKRPSRVSRQQPGVTSPPMKRRTAGWAASTESSRLKSKPCAPATPVGRSRPAASTAQATG